jgi:hypothetical protein
VLIFLTFFFSAGFLACMKSLHVSHIFETMRFKTVHIIYLHNFILFKFDKETILFYFF